jgi:hypothetical protein
MLGTFRIGFVKAVCAIHIAGISGKNKNIQKVEKMCHNVTPLAYYKTAVAQI